MSATDKTEQALPDYIPMDHEAMTSIHLQGDVISDTKARQQYARNVERKAVDYYKAQLRAAIPAAPPAQPQEPVAYTAQFQLDELAARKAGYAGRPEYLYAYATPHGRYTVPLYASPPRAVEPLTEGRLTEIITEATGWTLPLSAHYALARAVERAHNITKE